MYFRGIGKDIRKGYPSSKRFAVTPCGCPLRGRYRGGGRVSGLNRINITVGCR